MENQRKQVTVTVEGEDPRDTALVAQELRDMLTITGNQVQVLHPTSFIIHPRGK